MGRPPSRASTRRTVQIVLRGGLLLASVLMGIGLIVAQFEGRLRAHRVTISQIGRLFLGRHPSGIVAIGLLILLATRPLEWWC